MEDVVKATVDRGFWRGRRVLVSGHTGFIGGWAAAWLSALGADVTGFALPPPTSPSFHDLVGLKGRINGITGDVRTPRALGEAFEAARPDVVLHLAAQPLVRIGYERPHETFAVNVAGTLNLLDCVRRRGALAVVVMTSDKVYGTGDGQSVHREDDPLAARDPYGASKACCDLAVQSFAHSFFEPSHVGAAIVRAGNVIGGGDWQTDRLIPDAIRAFTAGRPLVVRHPAAVRPWQHVLDAVRALLILAQTAAGERRLLGPWNVGPKEEDRVTVGALAERAATAWGDGAAVVYEEADPYPETPFLAIDGSRARTQLGLVAPWNLPEIVSRTVTWYRRVLSGSDGWALTMEEIPAYEAACQRSLSVAART